MADADNTPKKPKTRSASRAAATAAASNNAKKAKKSVVEVKSPPSPKTTAKVGCAEFDSSSAVLSPPGISKVTATATADPRSEKKKNMALKIAIENGVQSSVFSDYDMCSVATGMTIPMDVLKDSSNPHRVFSVVDTSSKRYTVDACYDMVHAVATAFAMEARASGVQDWADVTVVVHDNKAEAMEAVYACGATVFVPCVGKDDAVLVTATTPATPVVGGGGGSVAVAGKSDDSKPSAAAGAPNAPPGAHLTGSSPAVSPSKQLGLDNLDIKVGREVVQKYKNAKEARGDAANGYKLAFHLSGVVKSSSGKARVVGTMDLVDKRGNSYWILKPDVLIDTLQALTENSHLSALSDFAKSAVEVPLRDIPNGADVGKLSYSKTGSAFPVTTTMFSLDVSEKVRPPEDETLSLVQMVHEVVTSKIFKEVYTDMMVNGGGRWGKLGGQIQQDNHVCWSIFKNCDLHVVNPSPLNTTLMDNEVKKAMSFLTGGVPAASWAADPLLSKVAYKGGSIPAGAFA